MDISENSLTHNATQIWWLRAVCLSVMVILLVGGITRLTGSGLSMVDWRPVSGILPPIGEQAWLDEFSQYQQSPQYKLVNKGMACLLYTSPSPRDATLSRMPSSA